MIKFTYNNIKNASTGYISLKLNHKYYFYISYGKDFDFCLKLKIVEELFSKL